VRLGRDKAEAGAQKSKDSRAHRRGFAAASRDSHPRVSNFPNPSAPSGVCFPTSGVDFDSARRRRADCAERLLKKDQHEKTRILLRGDLQQSVSHLPAFLRGAEAEGHKTAANCFMSGNHSNPQANLAGMLLFTLCHWEIGGGSVTVVCKEMRMSRQSERDERATVERHFDGRQPARLVYQVGCISFQIAHPITWKIYLKFSNKISQ